jgi:hypothetical protein
MTTKSASPGNTPKHKQNGKEEATPRLRDGDRMDTNEFPRHYAIDPIVYSAELLQGVVHAFAQ